MQETTFGSDFGSEESAMNSEIINEYSGKIPSPANAEKGKVKSSLSFMIKQARASKRTPG